jgi:shikimate kinase
LQELAKVRNPLYDATADLVFSTRNSSVYATAKALSTAIMERLDTLNQERVHADS